MRPPRRHRVGLYYFFLLCALDPIRVRHLVCTPSILWTMDSRGYSLLYRSLMCGVSQHLDRLYC